MARSLFGGTIYDLVAVPTADDGDFGPPPSLSLSWWTDRALSLPATDLLLRDAAGAFTVAASTIAVDPVSGYFPEFQGPDLATVLYTSTASGARALYPADRASAPAGTASTTVAGIARQATDTEASAGAVGGAVFTNPAGVAAAVNAALAGQSGVTSIAGANGPKTGAVAVASADISDLAGLLGAKVDQSSLGTAGSGALLGADGKIVVDDLNLSAVPVANALVAYDEGGRAQGNNPVDALDLANLATVNTRLDAVRPLVIERELTTAFVLPQSSIVSVDITELDWPVAAGEQWTCVAVLTYLATAVAGLKMKVRAPGTNTGTTVMGSLEGRHALTGPLPLFWGAGANNVLDHPLAGAGLLGSNRLVTKAEWKLRMGTGGGIAGLAASQVTAEATNVTILAGSWLYAVRKVA